MAATVTLIVTLPVAEAAKLEARIIYLCRDIAGASVVCQEPEAAVLANVGHRGANEQVEAMLCEGLYENTAKASALGLPLITKPYTACDTTSDLGTREPLETLTEKPLRNTVHGNLGADMVVLTPDPAAVGHFALHLIQLKRGTTAIGYPKSTCGPTNKGRSAYYIHKGLVDIGAELTALLKKRGKGDVLAVTCHYYLMTTAKVRNDAQAFLDERKVAVISGVDVLAPLMPKRLSHTVAELI